MSSPSRGIRLASVGLVLAAAAFGLTACGKSTSSAAPSSITIAINNAPTNLDPAENGNTPANTMIMDLAYEPLIFQEGNGTFIPGLATSWHYTGSDEKTFVLKLRKGVHFSDGSALTAKQVVASINHEKKANGPVAVYANQIASAVAVNSDTVQLNLANSDPVIATILTQHFLIGSVVGPKGTSNPDSLGTSTDGAGQYMLDASETVANDHYTFVPNPHYYNPSAVHFKKFTVRIISNPQTALSAIKSGQVAFTIGDFSTAAEASSPSITVHSTQSTWYAAFLFDRDGTIVPALKSQKVRQALNYAIDRKAIINAVFGKYGTPTDELSIKGYEKVGFDPSYVNHYAYNPTKAKQLLAAAGYPNGFTITVGSSPEYGDGDQVAQAIAGYWKAIGVTVKIQNYSDINSLVTPWLGKQLPAVTGDYDAQPMYLFINQALAKNAGTFNPFQTEDPQLTALMNKALAETNEAQQEKDWQAIQRRVVDLGWFVPVGVGDALYYGSSKLQGVTVSPTAFDPDPTQFHY